MLSSHVTKKSYREQIAKPAFLFPVAFVFLLRNGNEAPSLGVSQLLLLGCGGAHL